MGTTARTAERYRTAATTTRLTPDSHLARTATTARKMCGELGADGLGTTDKMEATTVLPPGEASEIRAALSFTVGPRVETIRVHRSPVPDNLGVNTVEPRATTGVLYRRSSIVLGLESGFYEGRAAAITVEVARGTLYGGSFTFSRDG